MSEEHIPQRVLLIDDDRELTTPLATLLLVAGYEVEMAFDGPTAVETAESFRPDVCLVDTNVPRLNVYDLVRCLRERLDQPPILANVTPFAERDDWDADAEFDLDFTKPSDPFVVADQLGRFLNVGHSEMRTKVPNTGRPRTPRFRRA
jgi:two-component system, chemotaxis family, CheB/CheR fusion protein